MERPYNIITTNLLFIRKRYFYEAGIMSSTGSSVSAGIVKSAIDPSLILSLTIPNIVLVSYMGFLIIDKKKE